MAARPLTGWNIPPGTLVAKAGQLLMMTRAVDENLGFPMPASLAEMHRQVGKSNPRLLTVFCPGRHAGRREAADVLRCADPGGCLDFSVAA
jgi:hypothetical protein